MSTKRMPAGEFNHFPSRARKLAVEHDIVIETRGEPTAVLMSFDRYQRLTQTGRTPMDVIADPAAGEIDFEIPRIGDLASVPEL